MYHALWTDPPLRVRACAVAPESAVFEPGASGVKVATGTGMTGDDSTVPAPIPANPHTREPREASRGQNAPHPRQ